MQTAPTVRLISLTSPVSFNPKVRTAEDLITYCARVSSPDREEHKDPTKLLEYCIKHKHWSIFEQASMTVEITCAIYTSMQILRHRSFVFQQMSQRYTTAPSECLYTNYRTQHPTNRQLSVPSTDPELNNQWHELQKLVFETSQHIYEHALGLGVAREIARSILPVSTSTTLMATGNIRSWIHFLEARLYEGAQQEIRDVAEAIRQIFVGEFPIISQALGWTEAVSLTSDTPAGSFPELPTLTN